MTETPLRTGYVAGSGPVLDLTTGVTVSDTRIRGIHAAGVGTILITGVSTSPSGSVKGSNIQFVLTTANETQYLSFGGSLGIRMDSVVKVSAPVSATYTTIFYG